VSIDDNTGHDVYILIHTISIRPQPTMKVNIRNQYSDIKLTDGRYFSIGAGWDSHPSWKLDASNVCTDSIPFLSTFGGFLTFGPCWDSHPSWEADASNMCADFIPFVNIWRFLNVWAAKHIR
jgi:hypothetical protein